jgi:hypothetical protein
VLQGLRLPLTGAEVLAGQRGNQAWPPSIAFDGFEASVKQVAGSVLGDRELLEAARLQRAKVEELRRADELDVRAEQKRSRANDEARSRTEQARAKRHDAAAKAEQRKDSIARTTQASKSRVDRDVTEKASRAKQAAGNRGKRVDAAERKAQLNRIERESEAVEQQRQAVKAAQAAGNAADKLAAKRSDRAERPGRAAR